MVWYLPNRFPHSYINLLRLTNPPTYSASYDNLRLYNLQADLSSRQFAVPFLIVPGHRTGVISQLYLDRTCRFILSAGGNRGWDGSTTEVLLGYEIGIEN